MLTVDLKQLKNNVRPAVDYLRSRLDEPIEVKGSRVWLMRTNARVAKLLLQKFLHQLHLEGYRILVIHSGLIEVHTPERERRRTIRTAVGAKPSAWETIPDLWYLTPPTDHPPAQAKQERDEARDERTLNNKEFASGSLV